MTEHKIRSMRPSDIPAVVEIQETILKRQVSARWRQALEHYIHDQPRGCLVALDSAGDPDGDRPIGFIIGEIKIWGFGLRRSGWLETISVHPKLMGAGVGHALGRKLLDYFQTEAVEGVYTNVRWDSGDLLSFFKSLGFEQSGLLNLHYRTRSEGNDIDDNDN